MPGPIVVLSSHVARGSVGGRGAGFALMRRGHDVWSVPTIMLPYHPGHGRGTRLVPDLTEFKSLLQDLAESRWATEVSAIMTGYLGHAEQAPMIADFIRDMRIRNPDLPVLCDPVIGDERGLYVPRNIAEAIRDHLLPLSDIATPNRHELMWLADNMSVDDNETLAGLAKKIGPKIVLATSAFAMMNNRSATLLVEDGPVLLAEHPTIPAAPNGPGDMIAALFLSEWLAHRDTRRALEVASAGIFELLARSVKQGADELAIATNQDSLVRPVATIAVRRILSAKPKP
ncbi:pyridoxal kinase [Coralliovum pocilloporae]|uniref:pyridoxal kinase n=1 Tax=Coralliovum pocilloporae TaxID=3066369 RepID=UPI003306DBAB